MDASYWQDTCSKALAVTRRWAAEQERSIAVLAALSEFHGRLRLLGQGGAVVGGALREQSDTLPLLHAKHVRGVENLMTALRDALVRYEALHAELARVHASVWERFAQPATQKAAQKAAGTDVGAMAQPSMSVVGAGRGIESQRISLPSSLQFIEWIQELDEMFAHELLLKLQLVDAISHDMHPAQLADVHRIWSLQPNLSVPALEQLKLLVDSLTVPESSEPRPDD